jgi:hypothetical protein
MGRGRSVVVLAAVACLGVPALPATAAQASDGHLRYARVLADGNNICLDVFNRGHSYRISRFFTTAESAIPAIINGYLHRTHAWKKPIKYVVTSGRYGAKSSDEGVGFNNRRLVWSPYFGEEGTFSIPRVTRSWWFSEFGCDRGV